MSADLHTVMITDEGRLAALEPAWRDLWRRCPVATPFQTPAWLLPWWRRFRPGALAVAAVWQGERLGALAPLYREENGPAGPRLLPIGISLSDYLDVLVDPAIPHAAAALIEALRRGSGCLTWDLEELAPQAAALSLDLPPNLAGETSPQSACPVLTLAEDSKEGLATIPASKRRKLRMACNRMARREEHEILRVDATGLEVTLADLFRLHAARWNSRGEDGVLADDTVRHFHEEAAPGLLREGLLRVYVLRLDGRTAGVYYGFHHLDRAYAYLGGFDPDFSFESPGTILIGHAIAEAAREGAREFHFLRGQEPYKYEWGAVDRWNQRCRIRVTSPADVPA